MLVCKFNLPPSWKSTFWYSFYLQNNCSVFLYFLSLSSTPPPPPPKSPASFCGISRFTLHWVCSEGKNTVRAEWVFSHTLYFFKWNISAASSNQQREFSHLNNFLTSETQTCLFFLVMLCHLVGTATDNKRWNFTISQDCLTPSC